ncbi:MAG TPA: transporter substrate-binding domain-containing protein [Actinomycetota bacterium]|nr:transporter substrate-binding domain-containing protein [Actinomycetota bacterium]
MSGRKRVLLSAFLGLALVAGGCGEEDTTVGGGGGGGGGEATPEPTFTTLEEGTLQVASCLDFPPFESVKGGDEVGFDVDLAEEVGNRLGLEVQWVRADFDTVFTAIAANQFDMVAAAVTSTGDLGEERDQIVDFSDPYFNSRQSLAVNVQETPDIASTDDLGEGDVIAVQRGSTGKAWAEDNLTDQGVELRTFQVVSDMFRDLEAGNVTGIINDEPGSAGAIEAQGLEGTVEVVEPIDTNEKYSFVFSPDNPELRDSANQALAEIIEDGTYATIFEQYFPGVEVPPEYQPSA